MITARILRKFRKEMSEKVIKKVNSEIKDRKKS